MTAMQISLYQARQAAWDAFMEADANFVASLADKEEISKAWVSQEEAAIITGKSPATISVNVKKGLYETRKAKGCRGVQIYRESLFE